MFNLRSKSRQATKEKQLRDDRRRRQESFVSKLESSYHELRYETRFTPFSSHIPQDVKTTLGPRELRRQDRISEFLFFERSHLRRLRIMSVIFYDRIRTHLPIVEFEEKIPAVEKLISLHSELSTLFDKSYPEKTEPIYNLGDVLDQWMTDDGCFEVFIEACKDFCKKQLSAGLWIQDQMNRNDQLHSEVKNAEEEELVAKLPFQNYLAAQMQHLTKYPMMTDSVLKLTSDGSPEHAKLKQCKERFIKILQDVNQSVKVAQDLQKHEEIAMNLDYSMFLDDTEIIGMTASELARELVPQKLIHYGILKFNNCNHDCLLFQKFFVMTTARATRQYILKVEHVDNQKIYPIMQIDHNFQLDTESVTEKNFQFSIQSTKYPPQKLTVACPLRGDKEGWAKAFEQIIPQKVVKYRRSKGSGTGSGKTQHNSGSQESSAHFSGTSTPISSIENGVYSSDAVGSGFDRHGDSGFLRENSREGDSIQNFTIDESSMFDTVLTSFDEIMKKYS